jgi:hypothetical protein
MTGQKDKQLNARRSVFEATLARFIGAGGPRRQPRSSRLRKMPLLRRFATHNASQMPDPVSLAAFAIDRVGPAAVRACASGVEVRVAVPDEAMAQVLRAALTETARRRDTDRLIRIVVD